DPSPQPVQEGRGVGRRVAPRAAGVRPAVAGAGVAGSGGAGLRDVVGALVEPPGGVVHLPEPTRGGADQLGGRKSDPAGGGEPEGVGREPHLGGGAGAGSVDVRAGDVSAGQALRSGVRQPDPARLRQSSTSTSDPPYPPIINSPCSDTMRPL